MFTRTYEKRASERDRNTEVRIRLALLLLLLTEVAQLLYSTRATACTPRCATYTRYQASRTVDYAYQPQ